MFLFSLPVGLQGGSKETTYQTSRSTNRGTSRSTGRNTSRTTNRSTSRTTSYGTAAPTSHTTSWVSNYNTNYTTNYDTIASTNYSTLSSWNTSINTTTSWWTNKQLNTSHATSIVRSYYVSAEGIEYYRADNHSYPWYAWISEDPNHNYAWFLRYQESQRLDGNGHYGSIYDFRAHNNSSNAPSLTFYSASGDPSVNVGKQFTYGSETWEIGAYQGVGAPNGHSWVGTGWFYGLKSVGRNMMIDVTQPQWVGTYNYNTWYATRSHVTSKSTVTTWPLSTSWTTNHETTISTLYNTTHSTSHTTTLPTNYNTTKPTSHTTTFTTTWNSSWTTNYTTYFTTTYSTLFNTSHITYG